VVSEEAMPMVTGAVGDGVDGDSEVALRPASSVCRPLVGVT
jgi:hypothetical protein